MLPTSPISLLVKRGIPRSRYIFRTMSQAAPDNLHKFFVYAPDRKEECTHTTRYAVRPQHLKDLDSHLLTKGYLPIRELSIYIPAADTLKCHVSGRSRRHAGYPGGNGVGDRSQESGGIAVDYQSGDNRGSQETNRIRRLFHIWRCELLQLCNLRMAYSQFTNSGTARKSSSCHSSQLPHSRKDRMVKSGRCGASAM